MQVESSEQDRKQFCLKKKKKKANNTKASVVFETQSSHL